MRTSKNPYPALPLITCDPYFNIWSFSDELNEDFPRHWTGMQHPLTGLITVDGVEKVFMGKKLHTPYFDAFSYSPWNIEQKSVNVTPLTTVYTFADEKIELEVSFITPLIPDDLVLLSRPVSYISYHVRSIDNKPHDISVYIDASAMLCTDTADEKVTFGKSDGYIWCSSGNNDMLKSSGDNKRISWGRLCLAAPNGRLGFVKDSHTKQKECDFDPSEEIRICDCFPALSAVHTYENITEASDYVAIGYDDIYSLNYFGKHIRGYWAKDGDSFDEMFKKAVSQFYDILPKVKRFEEYFFTKANAVSPNYAKIVTIAYRQVIAAHKLCYDNGEGVFVSKECFSNGCAATVDVTYPSIPLFLIYNPKLVEYMLNPIFKLISEGLWHFEFAPHDAGQYPLVDGQRYGLIDGNLKAELQMPVEECGNMLICVAALCRKLNDTAYAEKHFELLNSWAEYLVKFGYNPENQLCTDDFAGHLAHNTNLSAKAILGIASWGMLLDMMGRGNKFTAIAKDYAAKWKKDASDGDHYRLTFDKENTWSIKYNLVWDKLFGLGIFDDDIFKTEVEYYKTKIEKYGLPLDCRKNYTKSDWQMWSTILANDSNYTQKIVDAMLKMLADSPERVPFGDWYYTDTAHNVGFRNRTVQGGLFINMLKF